ncbi:MAG: hypothetical protein JW836_10605 [Deltaproteobacteria bacterium]|nr:hypothetical protein [Deltaproteobacteria bacterium]
MKSKTSLFAILCVLLGVLVTIAACSTAQTPKALAKPHIEISGTGMPGKALDVMGSGFIPGERIELVLEMGDVPMIVGEKEKGIHVDEKGMFKAGTAYPHKSVALPGLWDLIATGDKGSTAQCKVEIKTAK